MSKILRWIAEGFLLFVAVIFLIAYIATDEVRAAIVSLGAGLLAVALDKRSKDE